MDRLTLKTQAHADPLVARAADILKDRLRERGTTVVDTDDSAAVELAVDDSLPPEAFRIEQVGDAIRVAGGTPRGLLYGVGKFLHTSRTDGGFQPSSWRGTSAPRGAVRGMYFASHFHNWYHVAPDDELRRYVEDLALWGVNALKLAFPTIDLSGWDDPGADTATEMVRKYIRVAHGLGMDACLGAGCQGFKNTPQEIRATPLPDPLGRRGNSGVIVCPSKPEGMAHLLADAHELFRRLSDVGLELLSSWPYDEGGCACEQCAPWGCNGYLRLGSEIAKIGREYFPGARTVVSTWMFDTPPEGEWAGLSAVMRRGEGEWIDYILADAHEDFPRYPLDVEVPGNRPLLNFPEITMWGNSPWGGVGANPLPTRFQRLWDQVKAKVEGGFPYSEGLHDDMTKVVVAQFYWDADRTARETLEEYIRYEYGLSDPTDVLSLVDILETSASRSYPKQIVEQDDTGATIIRKSVEPVDPAQAQHAHDLAESVHERLPAWACQSWRWDLLRQRALLDRERFAGGGLETPAAQTALRRLQKIYHSQTETDDLYHQRVQPPLKRAPSRKEQ